MTSKGRDLEGTARAPALRRSSTLAEQVLWQRLRGRRFRGLKLRRQHGIGPYVADFCCFELRLVVEVDGGVHEKLEQAIRDRWRTENLAAEDWVVFRLKNEQVLSDVEGALGLLESFLEERGF